MACQFPNLCGNMHTFPPTPTSLSVNEAQCVPRVSDFAIFSMETHFPNSSGIHFYGWKTFPGVWSKFSWVNNIFRNLPPLFHGWKICSGICPHFFMGEKYFQEFGPNFWKPWACGYVAAGAFFFRKMAPIFLEALNLWVRCRRRLFFQKNGPHIFGSPKLVGTLPQAPFFFQKNGPHIFGSPELVGTLPQALFFSRKMAPIFLQALSLWVRCRRRFFFRKNGPPYVGGGSFWSYLQ